MSYAVAILRDRATKVGRLPCKTDFAPEDVARIKSALGPWPRALEAAGLKPPRDTSRRDVNREKRQKAARLKRRANRRKEAKTA